MGDGGGEKWEDGCPKSPLKRETPPNLIVVAFHCFSGNDQVSNQNKFCTTPEVSSSDKNKNTRNVSEENANNYCSFVGFVKFLSKYSSAMSVSQATLQSRIFSNPRNGKIALLLFCCEVDGRQQRFVSEAHVAVRFETWANCQEGSKCNDIYPN